MKKITRCLFISGLAFLLNSCHKDQITNQDIKAWVYNLASDSGMANVQVFLQTNHNGSSEQIVPAMSGAGGTVVFYNVALHGSGDYSYVLYVPSQEKSLAEAGFTGTRKQVDKANLDLIFYLPVTPNFSELCFNVTSASPLTAPDSINIYLQQKTLGLNVPLKLYSNSTAPANINSCLNQLPAGLWRFTIDKLKAGIHTISKDSIYMGYKSSVSYSLAW